MFVAGRNVEIVMITPIFITLITCKTFVALIKNKTMR